MMIKIRWSENSAKVMRWEKYPFTRLLMMVSLITAFAKDEAKPRC